MTSVVLGSSPARNAALIAMLSRVIVAALIGFATLTVEAGFSRPLVRSSPAHQIQSTLITNAAVLDGTGAPARRVSVRIVGDRIAAVGALKPTDSDETVDARGLTLAPGFIDTHSHHDRGLPEALAPLSQGITTIVVGQDGGSPAPLQAFYARLEEDPFGTNVASYVGHGTLRRQVMGTDFRRAASDVEIGRMEDLLREEMKSGALGLSTGLEYDPGIYSDPKEVIALARIAAAAGGRYISHVRSEDREFWKAIDEAIEIARQARIPVQISHIKLAMRSLWGQSDRLLKTLNAARARGLQITADIYPYTYWQSGMTVLFPNRDFDNRKEAEFALREVTSPEGLIVTRFQRNPTYEGKTLAEIAKLRGSDPPQAMMDMIREADGDVGIVATGMDEADVVGLMRWPYANFCSDGTSTGGHPRGFGAFTRVLGRYVRENRSLTLEEAIRKMTSLSAANSAIANRGTIKPGFYADLVLLDPAAVIDRSTIKEPRAISAGIHTVWDNGEVAFEKGATTGKDAGRVLRRSITAPPGGQP
jgi:N-acyl-D-amino-acid deacylase